MAAGRYRIERTLGEGGAGLVVEATDLRRKEPRIIKFLAQSGGVPSEISRSFLREARRVGQLRSEHVARVLDAGMTETGELYLVREYLAGQSVARALQAHGPFAVTTATEYLIQTCEGISEAHANGIVHGDVKPYNLYLVGSITRYPALGSIRIVDFGISRFAFSARSSFVTSMVIGYLPPERLRADGEADHRSDIWSLGATLYELLTGHAAFDTSQTLDRLVTAILDEQPPDPRRLRPEIPDDLAAIVARCLAKDPAARFESAGELATALLPFAWPRARTTAERAARMSPWATALAPAIEPTPPAPDPPQAANSPSLAPVTKTLAGAGPVPVGARAGAPGTRAPDAGEPEPETEVPLVSVPRWLVFSGLAAAGMVVFSAILLSASASGTDGDRLGGGAAFAAQAQASAVLPSALAAPTVSAAAPEIYQLVVQASPQSARITIDGTPVDGNPFRALYPKGGETHRVTASAPGYESKSEDVALTADVSVDLALKRSPTAYDYRSYPSVAWRPAVPVARASAEAGESVDLREAGTSISARADTSEPMAAP